MSSNKNKQKIWVKNLWLPKQKTNWKREEKGEWKIKTLCSTVNTIYCIPSNAKKKFWGKFLCIILTKRLKKIFTKVQLQYVDYLKDVRTDLGVKKNFHNGAGGNYDCIALFSYYVVVQRQDFYSWNWRNGGEFVFAGI